jgi:hypothetical protein
MAEPNTVEEQDQGPQQLDKPPYPGTSKIENGQAFDVAGKVLGGVDENGQPKQTAPEPTGPAFDFGFKPQPAETHAAQPAQAAEQSSGFDFGFKPVAPPTTAEKLAQLSPGAALAPYFFAKPIEGEENKGVAHSLHTFLSFPNALYHAFQDPATEQEKLAIQQKMNQMRAGQGMPAASTLPAVPGQYLDAATNTYDKKTPTPSRTQLALHRLIDAPADELDAKANKELETARELWDKRNDWSVSVPIGPLGMGISLPLGHAIALSQSVSGAADKMMSKIPMLGPLVNGISEKFENGDVSGGLADIALLKAAEHVHGRISGEESATPSRVFTDKGHELGKGAKAAFDAFKEKLKPAVSDAANAAKEDFKTAAPPSKAAPYDDNDYEIVRRTAEENHKADKLAGGEGISGIETARDIVEDGRQAIEAKRGGAVQKHGDKPITTNVFEDVANALAEKDQTTPGFQNEGMKVLDEHNFKDLTNKEADAIRKTLVAKNRLMEKNPWDAASLRESSPEYAAREAVIDSLRKGIYGSLQEAGVPEAYDWARDEAAHIRVRKALDRQIFNAEKTVRGSADVGPVRKVAAQVARAGSTAIGTGLGASIGGVPGAIIGGAAGTVAGEGISRAILPSDMTRNELMARSFAGDRPLATPGGPSVPPSQAIDVPYPQGPAGPDIPPPPAPIPPQMPPPDHMLHSALASLAGTTVERSNFDNLLSKFQEYLDKTPVDKRTEGDRALLQQLNDSQANRKIQITEAVKKAYDQNKAAREKWQKEVQKIQEKHAAETKVEEEKKDADVLADERIAHSPVMKATQSPMDIGGVEGRTSKQGHEHEHGHIMANVAEGLNPINFISEHHPDAIETGAAAAVQTDVSDAEEGPKGLAQRVVGILGGPAFDEVHNDIPMNQNTGARTDIARARQILREEGGLSGKDLDKVFDALYERAKGHVSNPEALALVQANIPLREEGLHVNYHMSPGRLAEYVKKLQGVYNGSETPTTPGVHEGDSDAGLSERKSSKSGRQGKEQDGAAGRVSSKEVREADEGAAGKRERSGISKTAEPQIAAHEAEGGSTFTPEGKNLAGENLHAVGSYPERTLQVDKLTPEVLDKFKKDNVDVLSQPGHAVGTWKDPDTGKTTLDISRTIDDHDEAIAAGKAANQKAIYHLGSGETIPTGGTGEAPQIEQSNIAKDRVSTRVPEGKNATENALEGEPLTVGMDSLKQTPDKLQQKFADTVRNYPGVKISGSVKDPTKVLSRFVDHAKDNLKFLYNQVAPEKQVANAKWYESANKLSKGISDQHGITEPQAAGTIATQSPQKDWDMNVSLARRITDIYKNHQDTVTTPEMIQKGLDIVKKTGANEDLGKAIKNLEGKKLSELTDPYDRAAWVRLRDEAHNPRSFESIDPGTGESTGLRTNADGSPSKIAWGSLPQISNALSILDDGSRENISDKLGGMHKVRNFYNNIIDPTNDQDVTIDTHAVAAALLQPLGGTAEEVLDNFGKAGKHTGTGVKGTYPLYAEAYRQAAKDLGIKPRELQSVVWEHVRNIFPSEWKSPANEKVVKDIWKKYSDGKQNLDATRQQILKLSEDAQKQVADTRAAVKTKAETKTKKPLDKQAEMKYSGIMSGLGGQ